MKVKRGDIFYCDLQESANQGSVQTGVRPVAILQNNVGNKYSPTTIVVPITSKKKQPLPTHVSITSKDIHDLKVNFNDNSVILCEQIITVDKENLQEKIGWINLNKDNIKKALATSLGLK